MTTAAAGKKRRRKADAVPESPWAKTRSRSSGGRAEKREALLRTAARLFIEEGFHTTSLDRLAESLSVTKPTLYYYFKDKDEILFRCQEQASAHVLKRASDALEREGPALTRLTTFLKDYIEAVTDDYIRCLVIVEEAALTPTNRRRIRASERRINTIIQELVEKGIADGSIAPCDSTLTTFALFGAANWMARWYRPGGRLKIEEVADHMVTLFLNGLSPRDQSRT